MRTHIAYGGSEHAGHRRSPRVAAGRCGDPLVKEKFGWDPDKTFHVPDEVREHMGQAVERGKRPRASGSRLFESYAKSIRIWRRRSAPPQRANYR